MKIHARSMPLLIPIIAYHCLKACGSSEVIISTTIFWEYRVKTSLGGLGHYISLCVCAEH